MAYTSPINSMTPERPMLFEVGRDVTLAEFIQLNDEALTVRDQAVTDLRAQIKNQPDQKDELEEKIELAEARAASVRDALQTGARLAFLAGHPEKIQAMMANPEKFMSPNKDWLHGATTYKAEQLLLLMYKSKTPAEVPALALSQVPKADKQGTLEYSLFRLVSFYHHVGPLAFSLLQAGAKADGVILAEAVRSNASPALVEQLLQHGADYKSAFDVMAGNPGYFGNSAQRLAAIRDTLANKLDITSGNGKPTQLRTAPRFRL